ncbi:class I SAM-dependent methyltransferase [Nocardioides sp.]|uniref:class I SAM-dependent methyltransferase n=1 Tax=Nocardioides sp. TaxID=35761 RepID=UPI0035114578
MNVEEQYADEQHLLRRRAVWRPGPDGRDPQQVALKALLADAPDTVVEIGCGTGAFAARVRDAAPGLDYLATDASARMVELAAATGVRAEVAQAGALPLPDDAVDAAAALWMLYHVPDLDAALADLRRVIRPGGRLVAVTNGDGHTATLRTAAGGTPLVTGFSSENGEAALRRHFAEVVRVDLATRAVFPDRAAALAYLRSTGEDVDWRLAPFDGELEVAGHVTVFTAG